MALARDLVRLRTSGITSIGDDDLVRFGAVEPHQVVKTALANADLYGPVLDTLELPPQAVLAVSCFAITERWTPARLASGTRYNSYYLIPARTVRDLGFELWPTDTFTDGQPDTTNPVHFDIVVLRGLDMDDVRDRTGSPAERRALRSRFMPPFERLLGQLQGPRPLSDES